MASRTIAQAYAQALDKARKEDVILLHHTATDSWFAVSQTADTAGRIYAIDDEGCTCQGWLGGHICKHHAAYLFATDRMPTSNAPYQRRAKFVANCTSFADTCANVIYEEWGEIIRPMFLRRQQLKAAAAS